MTQESPVAGRNEMSAAWSDTRLRGPWLAAARIAWVALVGLALVVLVVALPVSFQAARTLIYGALTTTLALVYIGSIVLLRYLLAPLTGSSELVIVASTLAIAVLFSPVRRGIQTRIDKRFYRRTYDAAKVLAAFGATARDETDLERLAAEMLGVVDETMRPEFVGLWLREPATHSTRDNARPDSTAPRKGYTDFLPPL